MANVTITTDNFEAEVLQASGPVLLDLWADWCGPCRMLSPIIDQVAAKHPELKVGRINVDEQPALAQAFNVTSIPLLILFKNGKPVNQSLGLIPAERLEQFLSE